MGMQPWAAEQRAEHAGLTLGKAVTYLVGLIKRLIKELIKTCLFLLATLADDGDTQVPTVVHPLVTLPMGQHPRLCQLLALIECCSSTPPQHHPAAKYPILLIYTEDGGAGLTDRSLALGFDVPWVGAAWSQHHRRGIPA